MLNTILKIQWLKNIVVKLIKQLNQKTDQLTIGDLKELPIENLGHQHVRNCQVLENRDALLAQLPSNGIVAELGVDQGYFSKDILLKNNPQQLHLIDLWDAQSRYKDLDQLVMDQFKNEIDRGQVIIHKGDSISELTKFPNATFDWIYIDTVHDYKTTKKELEISALKLKNKGFIAGHDYAIRSRDAGLKLGVIEAVHEFCLTHQWEIAFMTLETNGHNSFAIRKIINA